MSQEPIKILSFDQVLDRLIAIREPYHTDYLAMYSSWYGGIITEPALMMVPIDDHLVHRGDGIFEAFKCVAGKIYGLELHLDRMEKSAASSFITPPMSRAGLKEVVLATIRAANRADCSVRLIISRGPGGFTTNPYECPARQVYVVVTAFHKPSAEKYEKGVKLKSSRIPLKKAYYANIKSCNYLPNVLMKKEAVDAGVDYTVSVDEEGFLGEGSTENVGIVTKDRELLVPSFGRILKGITITRVMELARQLVASGDLTRVDEADITPVQAYEASEILMFGTSFDVLPVVSFDGRTIGNGRPGHFFARLLSMIREDMANNEDMLTPVR